MYLIINVSQLEHRRRAEHEWIKVANSHAAVDRVKGESERQPGIYKMIDAGCIRVEVDRGLQNLGTLRSGLHADAKGAGGLQGVDDVEIMRPGFCEVFPRMDTRIGGDEIRRPVGRRSLCMVAL